MKNNREQDFDFFVLLVLALFASILTCTSILSEYIIENNTVVEKIDN
jgi:hypothetical protein